MSRQSSLIPEFIELALADLKEGVIYISMVYGSAVHKCCCGCGRKVVTPFSPKDWKLIFDGDSISLRPSIGNWNFPCQSHYWITNNRVRWVPKWVDVKDEKKPRAKGYQKIKRPKQYDFGSED